MLPYQLFDHALVALFGLAIILAFLAIAMIPYFVIFKKAGFTPWIALLMIVPLVNLVALYVVAFSQWKVAPVRYGFSPAEPPVPSQS